MSTSDLFAVVFITVFAAIIAIADFKHCQRKNAGFTVKNNYAHRGSGLMDYLVVLGVLFFLAFIVLPVAWEWLCGLNGAPAAAVKATNNGAVNNFVNILTGR